MPTREEAWKLLCEYTQNENLRKHALAVEACVRAYARKLGGSKLEGGSRKEGGGTGTEGGRQKSEGANSRQDGSAALRAGADDTTAGQTHRRDDSTTLTTGAGATTVDEELWGLAALLHDFDYERWPNDAHHPTEEHPTAGSKILRERGYPEELIRAILSHADYTGVARQSPLEHTLFACDELAGFLTACALVKPGKSIFEVEAPSVKKKLKDKAFARGVNRQDVQKGAEELGIPLDEHIEFCIQAMRGVADALGLRGTG